MRTCIYGGTFNPPHLGHLAAAKAAVEELEVEEEAQPRQKRRKLALLFTQQKILTREWELIMLNLIPVFLLDSLYMILKIGLMDRLLK
jgi:nicotinic acid mononucleotide adenylyltransferase